MTLRERIAKNLKRLRNAEFGAGAQECEGGFVSRQEKLTAKADEIEAEILALLDEPEPVASEEVADALVEMLRQYDEERDHPPASRSYYRNFIIPWLMDERLASPTPATADEITRLRADQDDWRKGVLLVASALGEDHASCVQLSESVLRLRARVEELEEALGFIAEDDCDCHMQYVGHRRGCHVEVASRALGATKEDE